MVEPGAMYVTTFCPNLVAHRASRELYYNDMSSKGPPLPEHGFLARNQGPNPAGRATQTALAQSVSECILSEFPMYFSFGSPAQQ
jgi:hypothetical protein